MEKKFNKVTTLKGFTLIELMIVILIASILAGVGIPGMRTAIQNGRIVSQFNKTIGVLAFVRGESLKHKDFTVTLCASDDITLPVPVCSGNNTWESGWMVFTDADNDQSINTAIGEQLIRVGNPLTGENTLRSLGFPQTDFLTFDSLGQPESGGSFIICDERGAIEAKAVVLSAVGQARRAVDEDVPANDIVNDHAGVDVTCP